MLLDKFGLEVIAEQVRFEMLRMLQIPKPGKKRISLDELQ